jgi:hypothetical protein
MVKKGPFIISDDTSADLKLTGLLNMADVDVLRTLIIPALTDSNYVFSRVIVLTPTDIICSRDNLTIESYQQTSSLRQRIKDLKLTAQDILLVLI